MSNSLLRKKHFPFAYEVAYMCINKNQKEWNFWDQKASFQSLHARQKLGNSKCVFFLGLETCRKIYFLVIFNQAYTVDKNSKYLATLIFEFYDMTSDNHLYNVVINCLAMRCGLSTKSLCWPKICQKSELFHSKIQFDVIVSWRQYKTCFLNFLREFTCIDDAQMHKFRKVTKF